MSQDYLPCGPSFDSLVDRYLSINCAVFTPNPGRLDHVRRMVSGDVRATNVRP